jgi:hypothetical protein
MHIECVKSQASSPTTRVQIRSQQDHRFYCWWGFAERTLVSDGMRSRCPVDTDYHRKDIVREIQTVYGVRYSLGPFQCFPFSAHHVLCLCLCHRDQPCLRLLCVLTSIDCSIECFDMQLLPMMPTPECGSRVLFIPPSCITKLPSIPYPTEAHIRLTNEGPTFVAFSRL